MNPQLAVDILAVGFNGGAGDAQLLGNSRIILSPGNQGDYLLFPF